MCSPNVPWQDFATVDGGEISDQVAGNEPQTTKLLKLDAEQVRIEFSAAASAPGLGRGQELGARDVMDVETNFEIADKNFVELTVQQGPAPITRFLVFTDPMIFELAWVKVGAEASAASGGNSVLAKDCDGKQHVMAADANQTLLGRPGEGERTVVKCQQRIKHLLHRADMAFAAARFGNPVTIEWFCGVLVDQQGLRRARDTARIGRQHVEERGMGAGRAKGRMPCIMFMLATLSAVIVRAKGGKDHVVHENLLRVNCQYACFCHRV
ncbi:hypothetical protein [Rhizobium leguminosarum]|uniref:hypothetical protein n=1 Tax=Rhizobium leguminosarum TaxID=384 RepID=UPI001441998B|nr:hypothetical protein [Rhizobium leguminosarum]